MERTFRGGEPVDTADVYKTETQFTYVDGDEYVFMDNVSWGGVFWGVGRGSEEGKDRAKRKKKSNPTPPPPHHHPPTTQQTYEETRVKRAESWAKYLKEGTEVQLVTWNGNVISVDLPTAVELEVVDVDPGVKGNTMSGGSKPATLETGAVVQVPLFVNQGERIKINTTTDEYLGRSQG